MFVPADSAGAVDGDGAGDPSLGGWSVWNMQKNGGFSAASTSTLKDNRGLSAASTSTVKNNRGLSAASSSATKNEGYSILWPPRSLRPTDALAPEHHELAKFYLEAARRLPIADIPYLADCISFSGLAVGLADPVTNIILTTINAFAKRPPFLQPGDPDDAVEQTRKMTTFAVGARNSRKGLIMFLMCYFHNLTVDQAKKCLDMAGHDIPLAVNLVDVGCWGSELPLLQPDAARTKTALHKALFRAGCSKTEDLVRLMTWRYPRDLLDPVLDDLRGGKQLSAGCVHKICNLLRRSWLPPPTPAPTTGTYWDISGNVTTITKIRKGLFATTTISKDLVTTTSITSTCPGDCMDNGVHLSTELSTERSSIVEFRFFSWRKNPDFLPLMKMSLLDTVHGFYINALGILPSHALRDCHLIRAVLTAGHCYGPLDPVSNIILNSVWYDAVFPLLDDVSNQIGAADILDARSLSRAESCSLDGLVALACNTYSIPEQQAVEMLCTHRFNLSCMVQGPENFLSNLASAALVAKHPQPVAFGNFLKSLTPGKLARLRSLTSDKGLLSDGTFERLKEMVSKETARIAAAAAVVQSMAPDLGQSALETLSARRSSFISQQEYVRAKLDKLLLDYGHEKGHIYKLGIVCGVTTARYGFCTTCYHVNFLASMDVSSDSTRSWALFFAEFWSVVDSKVEHSTNVPFCCPVKYSFDAHSIRCIVCDRTSCKIAHPSSGEHVYFTGNTQLNFPVHHQWGADLDGMLESDFIYLDHGNIAKILSESSSSPPRKKPRANGVSCLPQRLTRARAFTGHLPDPVWKV